MEFSKPFSNKPNLIEIACYTIYQTEKAIQIDDGMRVVWLPISQCEDWPDVGFDGVVILPEWLAKDKEMI